MDNCNNLPAGLCLIHFSCCYYSDFSKALSDPVSASLKTLHITPISIYDQIQTPEYSKALGDQAPARLWDPTQMLNAPLTKRHAIF